MAVLGGRPVLLAAVLCLLLARAQATPSDAELLLAFKATFTNGGTVLSSWVAGTDPCNTTTPWEGVGCDLGGQVFDYVTYM